MKLYKCLRHAFNMVLHSKLRSWLTILGIVIGVASVIAILALGEGMQQAMNSRFDELGADLITLSAGGSRGMGGFRGPPGENGGNGGNGATDTDDPIQVDKTDVQVLKGLTGIVAINPTIRGSVDVYYLGKKGSVSLTGVDQKTWSEVTTDEIADGRMLGPADSNVVVIGGRLADGYFDSQVGINKMLTIEDRSFRVVGIMDDSSTSIYMPISMAYDIIEDSERDVYDSVTIKIEDETMIDEMMDKIEYKLMLKRHVTERTQDFTLSSSAQMSEQIQEMSNSMSLFLTAIAAVSLLVGAVGIANTMFTSVLEKTKEIGIMKAIGAKNRDIMSIFIINAALIGLIGGMIGVLFGIVLSDLMPYIMPDMRMMGSGAVVTTSSVIGALIVAVLIGMVAGLIPAYKASKLKPVDALRYE